MIASWWCWDYESPFGNRPYTEHLLFLLLPIIPFVIKHLRLGFFLISIFAIMGILRVWSFNTGFMSNQRYTPTSYFASLAVWNPDNVDRWNFTRSCTPYGDLILEKTLIEHLEEIEITPIDEFICTAETPFNERFGNVRYFYRVELDKKIPNADFSGVYLVIDATDKESDHRYYYATELMNDRFEGQTDWVQLTFEGIIHDNLQEYDQLKIYIWNMGGQSFSLKNIKITLEEYSS